MMLMSSIIKKRGLTLTTKKKTEREMKKKKKGLNKIFQYHSRKQRFSNAIFHKFIN